MDLVYDIFGVWSVLEKLIIGFRLILSIRYTGIEKYINLAGFVVYLWDEGWMQMLWWWERMRRER